MARTINDMALESLLVSYYLFWGVKTGNTENRDDVPV